MPLALVPVEAVLPTAGLGAPTRNPRRIPEATVARLPVYLRSLLEVADAHTVTISSERLAEMAGVNAAKVRKDLSYLGSYGTRGVGYDIDSQAIAAAQSNGDASTSSGIAVHIYAANQSMTHRVFYDSDGELLIVPQERGAIANRVVA